MLTKSLEKERVEAVRVQWKKLWHEKLNDRTRAEGIASGDYTALFVDKGTIIHATRDFKALNFREILEQHQVLNPDRYVPPDASVGGWSAFIKRNITSSNKPTIKAGRAAAYKAEIENAKEKQQNKKGGRGWLHT